MRTQNVEIRIWGATISTAPQIWFDDLSGNNCAQTTGLGAHSWTNDFFFGFDPKFEIGEGVCGHGPPEWDSTAVYVNPGTGRDRFYGTQRSTCTGDHLESRIRFHDSNRKTIVLVIHQGTFTCWSSASLKALLNIRRYRNRDRNIYEEINIMKCDVIWKIIRFFTPARSTCYKKITIRASSMPYER